MAMLAEPRQRKRYNLCPRGKALYEDDSRFGTKMLEKMGWTKGKGLGANEDGEQDFVRLRFKNDAEGLGYEDRNDQWTVHEQGFNGLLKALNGDAGNSENENEGSGNASEEETRPTGFGFGFKAAPAEEPKPKTLKQKISGVSLEEKSKLSKARVHYKKFTRGKDLAQYSEKDLANIFGKKATEDIEVPVAPVVPSPEQPKEEEKNLDPNFAGVHTVSTGLSVTDYFKQKMEEMKKRLSKNNNSSNTPAADVAPLSNGTEDQPEAASEEEPPKKKKKKKDKKLEEEQCEQMETERPEESVPEKKRNKKSKQDLPKVEEIEISQAEETNPPKRKKKKKDKQEEVEETPEIRETPEEINPPKRKKKKKDKQDSAEEVSVEPQPVAEEPKKRKKSKGVEETTPPPEEIESVEKPVKKSKKSKKDKAEEHPVEQEEETAPKSKKKKKKHSEPEEEAATPQETPVEIEEKKKKKHKSGEVSAETNSDGNDSDSPEEQCGEFLSMCQLIKKRDSYNEFQISSFCAEKFHVFKMNAFKKSSLAQITGYSIDDNIRLKVVEAKADAQRIINLWEGKQSKYMNTYKKMPRGKLKYQIFQAAEIKKVNRRKAFSGI